MDSKRITIDTIINPLASHFAGEREHCYRIVKWVEGMPRYARVYSNPDVAKRDAHLVRHDKYGGPIHRFSVISMVEMKKILDGEGLVHREEV